MTHEPTMTSTTVPPVRPLVPFDQLSARQKAGLDGDAIAYYIRFALMEAGVPDVTKHERDEPVPPLMLQGRQFWEVTVPGSWSYSGPEGTRILLPSREAAETFLAMGPALATTSVGLGDEARTFELDGVSVREVRLALPSDVLAQRATLTARKAIQDRNDKAREKRREHEAKATKLVREIQDDIREAHDRVRVLDEIAATWADYSAMCEHSALTAFWYLRKRFPNATRDDMAEASENLGLLWDHAENPPPSASPELVETRGVTPS